MHVYTQCAILVVTFQCVCLKTPRGLFWFQDGQTPAEVAQGSAKDALEAGPRWVLTNLTGYGITVEYPKSYEYFWAFLMGYDGYGYPYD